MRRERCGMPDVGRESGGRKRRAVERCEARHKRHIFGAASSATPPCASSTHGARCVGQQGLSPE